MGRVPQKSPIISGSFAKIDLQLKLSYGFLPPCTSESNRFCIFRISTRFHNRLSRGHITRSGFCFGPYQCQKKKNLGVFLDNGINHSGITVVGRPHYQLKMIERGIYLLV